MTKRLEILFLSLVFIIAVGAIVFLLDLPGVFARMNQEEDIRQSRIIIPQHTSSDEIYPSGSDAERMAYEDIMASKVALRDGEHLVAVVTEDFDGDLQDEQVIAYRNLLELESPIILAYIDFDQPSGTYQRIWEAATPATRPGTFSLYTNDMIGDRSVCVLALGMNGAGEQTLTIFRKNWENASSAADARGIPPVQQPFGKIMELRIDGSISVQETERPRAYQLGYASGQSFSIAAYGRDYESSNILDQIEIIYAYNPVNGLYEQTGINRIPGTQIEERRVREILSGGPAHFEQFLEGLWYYVGPGGTADSRQYIYFDPGKREIIFFGDGAQQVFSWMNSSSLRNGLYVSSRNISVSTLRRYMNVELQSLDSIRIKVSEDVQLKILVSAPWDGSYRKAPSARGSIAAESGPSIPTYLDMVYNGSIGTLTFLPDGSYELLSAGTRLEGKYSFFTLDSRELLELRPGDPANNGREVYLVERTAPPESGEAESPPPAGSAMDELTLTRVRLGTKGIQEVHESPIRLSRARPEEDRIL
ncbi:pallilysin-related adhesin [Treponema sp. OttesenSCG-928-L16]|nr:pallilysin-related adhesin [Treponema sp. OttesenSCG-928-L16]